MFKLPLLLKCKRGFFSFLVSVFMISVVDLLSAGSSSAEERLCEELERLHGSPWGGGGRVREGFGGVGGVGSDENRPHHVSAGRKMLSELDGWVG